MNHLVSYAIPGIPYGCDFAIVAVGLILTYRATGVFNFAFGAQAYTSAYVFDVLVKNGVDKGWSFVVAVLLLAPALGLAFHHFLFRHIATKATTAKVVTSLGLLVALPNIVTIAFGNRPRLGPPSLILNPNVVYFHVGSTPINGNELATVVVTVATVAVLAILMRGTSLGLRMRATVESRRMARLEGVNADAVVAGAWALSSFLAGLAGVLLAPLYASIDANNFVTLMVTAIMVAAIGGFRSMPWAVAGGVVFGVLEEILVGYLPTGSIWATGLQPALPFVILVLLLLLHPGLRHLDDVDDPLVSVDPPLPPPAATMRAPQLDRVVRTGGRVLAVAFVVSCLTWIPDHWVFTFGQGLTLSTIFLSITLLTGLGGQLSLAQATFAGVGAFAAGQMATHFGMSVILGAFLGAAIAAIIGSIAAVPALRLKGLALALLTFALALLFDSLIFPTSWAGGGAAGVAIPRPQLGPISFAGSRPFFVLALVALIICSVIVLLVRRGTVGRYLAAMRGSSTAAASIGISLARSKVTVFALSAAIAGFGGAFYGSLQQTVTSIDFNSTFSLVFIIVVITTGVRTVEGAVQAGIGYVVLQQLFTYLPPQLGSGSLVIVLFAFGAMTYAKHPEGMLEFQKHRWTSRFERLLFPTRHDEPQAPAPTELSSVT